MSSRRRKNPHPKRAVNARTVLKAEKEEPKVLCLKIPDEDEDDLEANHQIQKEEEEEEEGEDDDDVERLRRILCVPRVDVVMEQNQMREEESTSIAKRSDEKERARVRCLREGVSISIQIGRTHAYAHERETVRM